MLNVITCSSMSPAGRIVRAALRNISETEKMRQFPITPLIAGYKEFEEILKNNELLVIDGCGNCCSARFLDSININPHVKTFIEKYPRVTDASIKKVESRIKKAIIELKS